MKIDALMFMVNSGIILSSFVIGFWYLIDLITDLNALEFVSANGVAKLRECNGDNDGVGKLFAKGFNDLWSR